jgi:hypothetical protein
VTLINQYLFISVILTQYFLGDKIEKNVMGGVVVHMGKRRGVYRVWCENLRESDHLGG